MRKILSSIFFLIFFFSAFSQENDFQSWYALSLNKKIAKKTLVTLKTGLRLRENSSLYSKKFFDVKLKKNLNKRVSIASGFRYATNWDKRFNISKNRRFYVDLNYKDRVVKRLSYSIRNRCQTQGDIYGYKVSLRQKFLLAYNIRKTKITPKLATEYFFNLEDGVDKLRSTVSVSHPITKKLDFDLAYRIQQEFNVNNPETLFIFEGKLSYDL
tara:strand:+ start:544 stop:1182 length:639 start_codon:yes stop_codon:yes gene_type:complete